MIVLFMIGQKESEIRRLIVDIFRIEKSHNNNRDNTYPLVESTGEKQNKLPWTLSGYLFKEIKNKLLVGY